MRTLYWQKYRFHYDTREGYILNPGSRKNAGNAIQEKRHDIPKE
jgi:hypothetical protein